MELGCELFGSGMLWWLAVSAGLLAILFWPSGKEKRESAWDILHKKFAEGTLSVAEYQERKDILEQNKRKK
jgi:uncharacterized membrane protein